MNQRDAMHETIAEMATEIKFREIFLHSDEQALVDHIIGMPARTEGFSEAKLGRWLGWIQGVACAKGWLTLEDCKRINQRCS